MVVRIPRNKIKLRLVGLPVVILTVMSLVACGVKHQKEVEQEMKQPINCATAKGDIRLLQHEKAHVTQQIAEGVTAIFPAGLVLGVASGTEETKAKVATGEYNEMIDQRIAEIKEQCGVD
jgi:hypothetical protein